jgi:hypothetical protein
LGVFELFTFIPASGLVPASIDVLRTLP